MIVVTQRRAAEFGREQFAEARPFERAGRFLFACHFGDSGRNGRITISGIAGINPLISVYRHTGVLDNSGRSCP